MSTRYFTLGLFAFLRDLAANNDREWFHAHRDDFELHVRQPALAFVADLASPLAEISTQLRVDARPSRGSLLRMNRDLRFAPEGGPYHTKAAMRFGIGTDPAVRTPVLYLHLKPKRSFMAAGYWRPPTVAAYAIRHLIDSDPTGWEEAAHSERFVEVFTLEGNALVRAPRGFDPHHPHVTDLRRTDFAGVASVTQRQVTSDTFLADFVENCHRAAPLMAFLCRGVGLPF